MKFYNLMKSVTVTNTLLNAEKTRNTFVKKNNHSSIYTVRFLVVYD